MKKLLCFILGIFLITTPVFASISFNGTTQNIYQSTGFTLGWGTGQKQLTMAGWFNVTGVGTSNNKIYGKSTLAGQNASVSTQANQLGNQTFNFGVQDCGLNLGQSATGTLCPSMGMDNTALNSYVVTNLTTSSVAWSGRHFVVIVWSNTSGNSNDWVMYIDHIKQASGNVVEGDVGVPYSTANYIEDLTSVLYIGSACGDTCPSEFWPGTISEIMLWTTALTQADVDTLWNNGVELPCNHIPLNVKKSNLVFYFTLGDQTSGNVTTASLPVNLGNVSGFAVNSVANAPTWSTDMTCGTYVLTPVTGGKTIHF